MKWVKLLDWFSGSYFCLELVACMAVLSEYGLHKFIPSFSSQWIPTITQLTANFFVLLCSSVTLLLGNLGNVYIIYVITIVVLMRKVGGQFVACLVKELFLSVTSHCVAPESSSRHTEEATGTSPVFPKLLLCVVTNLDCNGVKGKYV
jgi:hypothetical protein